MSTTESRKNNRDADVAMLRIAPDANVNEEAAADVATDDSDSRTSARSGRTIRRPTQLALYTVS